MSIGAFLENLLLAAPGHGYKPQFTVIAQDPKQEDLIQVWLSSAGETGLEILDRIRLRRTVRSGQLRRPIPTKTIDALVKQAGFDTHFFGRDSSKGRYLAEATIEANRTQAGRNDAQSELADWIRFSTELARARRDGLTQESMEISGLAGWYVRHFMDRHSVLEKSFREQGVERVREQVGNCGGWLVVTSPDASLPSLLETGRRTERMWLGAIDQKIAIHPMTQILEESPFQDQVGRELGITNPIQFILRIGYVENYPQPVSLRRPVSSILRS